MATAGDNYFVAGYKRRGLDEGHLVNAVLQTVDLYKFYSSETSYFSALDMTMDGFGFYLIWGSLFFCPALYAYSAYYFVHHGTNCSPLFAVFLLLLGFAATNYKYEVDQQKQVFRKSEVEYQKVYTDSEIFIKYSGVNACRVHT
jgi:hypothetical protein